MRESENVKNSFLVLGKGATDGMERRMGELELTV